MTKERRIPRAPNASGAKCYIRNSGRDERDILKPESQLLHCQQVAQRLHAHYTATDIYDEGEGLHSAFKRENLDQFDDMLADAIADPHCKFILSYDASRIFRNSEAGEHTLKRLELHGLEWHSYVNGHLSIANDEHRLKTKVQMMMDEEESRRTSQRLRDIHYAPARAKGLYFSHTAPYGLARSGSVRDNSLTWTPNPDFPLVLEILKAYVESWSSGEAWEEVKHRAWSNGSRVQLRMVQQVIASAERYHPHVPAALYAQVLSVRSQKAQHRLNAPPQKHPRLLLRGLVSCAVCGVKLVSDTRVQQGRDTINYYYRHPEPGCLPRAYRAEETHEVFWEQFHFPVELRPELLRLMTEPAPTVSRSNNLAQIERLEAELAGFDRMRARGEIPEGRYRQRAQELEQDIESLQQQPAPAQEFAFSLADAEFLIYSDTRALRELSVKEPKKFNHWLYFLLRAALAPRYKLTLQWLPPYDSVLNTHS